MRHTRYNLETIIRRYHVIEIIKRCTVKATCTRSRRSRLGCSGLEAVETLPATRLEERTGQSAGTGLTGIVHAWVRVPRRGNIIENFGSVGESLITVQVAAPVLLL